MIRAIGIACVAFMLGLFGGAYYQKGQEEVKLLKADQKTLQQVKAEVPAVIEKSNAIEAAIDRSDGQVQSIKAKVRQRIQNQQEKIHEKVTEVSVASGGVLACPAFTLDVGTVRLLNAARQGTDLDATASGDETLSAPSSIGIDKLLENDLEVVRLYRDLAKRHDELVEWVSQKLQQQAR